MIHSIKKVTILGAGSWGTALAHVLSSHPIDITLLVRNNTTASNINLKHCNAQYFPDYILSSSIHATTNAQDACLDADVILYAGAMQQARSILESIQEYIPQTCILVNASKGIEQNTLHTMSMLIQELLPHFGSTYSILSGPSFAKEVMDDKFTTVVVASNDVRSAMVIQELFSTPKFKVYRSDDVIGVELAGAIKNVIAIASGIVDEVEQSNNARAGIITRGLAEMARLGMALGAKQQTFMGLAGIGDLLLTCTGDLSRNRHVGKQLAKGLTADTILSKMNAIAEGIYTCNAVHSLAKQYNIYMPITEAVYSLLYGYATIHDIYSLFTLPSKKQEYL